MEFIPGKDLEQLSSQDRQLFQGREGKRLLHEIGRLICLDIVTNNWDRLPVIWHNEGNSKNVFFQERTDESGSKQWSVVGIDQGLTALSRELHAEGYDNYMDRVQRLITHISSKPEEEAEQLQKLRTCLKDLFQLSPQDSLEIQAGILAAAADFAKLEETELVKIKQEVAALISLDWAGVWSSGVKGIHIPMLVDIIQIFRQLPPS